MLVLLLILHAVAAFHERRFSTEQLLAFFEQGAQVRSVNVVEFEPGPFELAGVDEIDNVKLRISEETGTEKPCVSVWRDNHQDETSPFTGTFKVKVQKRSHAWQSYFTDKVEWVQNAYQDVKGGPEIGDHLRETIDLWASYLKASDEGKLEIIKKKHKQFPFKKKIYETFLEHLESMGMTYQHQRAEGVAKFFVNGAELFISSLDENKLSNDEKFNIRKVGDVWVAFMKDEVSAHFFPSTAEALTKFFEQRHGKKLEKVHLVDDPALHKLLGIDASKVKSATAVRHSKTNTANELHTDYCLSTYWRSAVDGIIKNEWHIFNVWVALVDIEVNLLLFENGKKDELYGTDMKAYDFAVFRSLEKGHSGSDIHFLINEDEDVKELDLDNDNECFTNEALDEQKQLKSKKQYNPRRSVDYRVAVKMKDMENNNADFPNPMTFERFCKDYVDNCCDPREGPNGKVPSLCATSGFCEPPCTSAPTLAPTNPTTPTTASPTERPRRTRRERILDVVRRLIPG